MDRRNVLEGRSDSLLEHLAYSIGLQWKQHWEVLVFLFIILTKTLYYGKQISPEYFSIKALQLPIIASILPIIAISYLFKEKSRIYFLYIVNILISLSLMADTIYYGYFKDIVSIGVLRNITLLQNVTSSVGALIHMKHFLYFLDVIILIPVIKNMRRVERKEYKFKVRFKAFVFILLLGIILNGKYIIRLSKDQPLLITNMSNKIYVAKVLGNINFHMLDFYNFVSNEIKTMIPIDEGRKEEIKAFLQNKNKKQGNNLAGVGKGKNLILIQVEALQQFVVNKKINGEEITPNLNKWINKSLYFDNYFYQVGSGNTSDGEFMSNNSLYPAASGAAYYLYTGNTLNSLPKALGGKGYYSAAFHGYIDSFWNRNLMYNTQGFSMFYGEQSFEIDEEVGMGLSDRSFFHQSLDKIKELPQPFYSFMVTLSSHFPYDDVKGHGSLDIAPYKDSFLGNYLLNINYVDSQLGMFLDKLEQEGIMDNSIVVIYGDHSAIPKEYIEELYEFEGITVPTDLQWFQYQKVPMLIHFPQHEHRGINHSYSGQMDLYPTLANLFDLPKEYMLGKDILNDTNNKVIFRNGSFTNGEVFYVSWTDSYYEIATGNLIEETKELKNLKEEALKELNYSDDILNHNFLKTLIGSD